MGSPSVTCYPTPGKAKARRLLEAFAAGAGGVVSGAAVLQAGPAAFYGVTAETLPLWRQARAEGRDWYYLDNAYFDVARGSHFRVTRGALQASGAEAPDWNRWAALGLEVEPWRRDGGRVLVCPQSDWFMRGISGWPGGAEGWVRDVCAWLRAATERPIEVRSWAPDKARQAVGLAEDLKGSWAVVVHSSAAAVTALLAGVPVFTTGQCAATRMGLSELERIESPRRPDGREAWAAALAGQQWTVEDLRTGAAWRRLHGHER